VNYTNVLMPVAVLGAMMVVQLLMILVMLKRRDSV